MKYLACAIAASCAMEAYDQWGWRGVAAAAVLGYVAAHFLYRKITRKQEA